MHLDHFSAGEKDGECPEIPGPLQKHFALLLQEHDEDNLTPLDMSVNDTFCSPTSTCVILDGATTNGTFYVTQYDPGAPVIWWRNRLELATICICNSLTFLVIIARIWYRWFKLNKFRWDDRWMAFVLVILMAYTGSQIGTNIYGSGMHFVNIPESWRRLHWHYQLGWVGYWIITTAIKLSVCSFFLELITQHLKGLRYLVYGLCGVIISLGITIACAWLFACQPVLSNFLWAVDPTSCVNLDIFRWLWIGLSIPIDIAIMSVGLRILKRTSLRRHERNILKMIFCATLLGTITCAIGIFGAYESRTATANNAYWDEVPFVMMNDIEILMYALGASFPVLSKYIVQRVDPGPSAQNLNFTSWARHIPDFFLPETLQQRSIRRSTHEQTIYAIELQSATRKVDACENEREVDVVECGEQAESTKSGASGTSGTSGSDSQFDPDLEKGSVVPFQTEIMDPTREDIV